MIRCVPRFEVSFGVRLGSGFDNELQQSAPEQGHSMSQTSGHINYRYVAQIHSSRERMSHHIGRVRPKAEQHVK